MSTITQTEGTNNQASFNIDQSKIFIFGNRYEEVVFKNLTVPTIDVPAGTLLGRVAGENAVTICKSGATDGSQWPIGILATSINQIAGDATIDVNMCINGDVAEEKIIFDGSDTMATVVSNRILRDWLQLAGVKAVSGTELTGFDN